MSSRGRVAFLAAVTVIVLGTGLAVDASANHSETELHSIGSTGGNGAAVQLFASVMMLFWYVLRLFMRR